MTRMHWGACAVAGLLLAAGAAYGGDASKGGEASKEAQAPATTTKQKEGTYKSGDLRTVTLIVKQVDPKNHRVTFEATVTPEANVTASGKPIKLDQLKEGDTVKAAFDPKSGDVVRVDVTPAAPK
jgi:Cu/Ag efflux protein CusF